jgi:hypothetical protein
MWIFTLVLEHDKEKSWTDFGILDWNWTKRLDIDLLGPMLQIFLDLSLKFHKKVKCFAPGKLSQPSLKFVCKVRSLPLSGALVR